MKVHQHIPAKFVGGAERQVQYLIKYLRAITKPEELHIMVTYESQNISSFIEGLKKDYDVSTALVTSKKVLATIIDRWIPDLTQFYTSPMCYRALQMARHRPKVVEVIHNKNQFSGDATSYPKDRTHSVVCVSEDARDFILPFCAGVPTTIILNGVDESFFYKDPAARSVKPVVGYAGRICPDKGIERLLRLAPRFKAKLEIVGQDFGNYHEAAWTNVEFHEQTDVPEVFYQHWWATLSASPHESFGLMIAESLACDTPVVMAPCGGIESYVQHGKQVLIARTDDEFVKYVNGIIDCAYTLEPTSVSFKASSMAAEYLKHYRQLLGAEPMARATAKAVKDMPKIFQRVKDGVHLPGRALGVTPAGWYGVVRALAGMCDHYAEPSTAIEALSHFRPKYLVLGCFKDEWLPICQEAHRLGIKVIGTWHASFILNEFDRINRVCMGQLFKACYDGHVDHLATPHKGLAESWTEAGMFANYLPNVIDTSLIGTCFPRVVDRDFGPHIGILGSAQTWKNMECQIFAASRIPGAVIHVQEQPDITALRYLGTPVTVHPKTLTDDEYYALIQSMDVNMCVSLSEVYSYLTAESFLLGVPVLTGKITPLLYGGHSKNFFGKKSLADICGTAHFEDPKALTSQLRKIIGHNFKSSLSEHMRAVNNEYIDICNKVIAVWEEG